MRIKLSIGLHGYMNFILSILLFYRVIMSSIMVFNISFYADVGGIYLYEVNEKLKKQAD